MFLFEGEDVVADGNISGPPWTFELLADICAEAEVPMSNGKLESAKLLHMREGKRFRVSTSVTLAKAAGTLDEGETELNLQLEKGDLWQSIICDLVLHQFHACVIYRET